MNIYKPIFIFNIIAAVCFAVACYCAFSDGKTALAWCDFAAAVLQALCAVFNFLAWRKEKK